MLIKKVRNIYSGKLTYAANWNSEVSDISFWDDLDFIGIQAYFPIAKNNNPTLSELEAGWVKHLEFLEVLNKKYNKPILFTELGYKSTPDAGKTPWEWNTLGNRFYKKISKRTQVLCYQAFFNMVWQQPWFGGVHIWEWQSRSNTDGNNNAFTIQDKPALNIVAKGFAKIVK
jgi:Glycoside Hydrolase Family 113